MTVERTVSGSLAGRGQEHPDTALSNRANGHGRSGNDVAMASPVDPARHRSLVRALNQAEMYDLAYEVNTGAIDDLERIAARADEAHVHGVSEAVTTPLIRAIQAGEYGTYQETDPGAAV
jgi:hypothetical protein